MSRGDFHSIHPTAIGEISRQGESCLQGTMQLAVANDQRAVILSGVFGTAAAALAALLAALYTSPNVPPCAFLIAIAVAGSLLFVASIICAESAKPTDFFVTGYEPRLLAPGFASEDITPALTDMLDDVQRRINHNRAALKHSGRLLTVGVRIAEIALPMSVIAFFTVSFVSRHPF
jgi:hypothetical protein